MEVVKGVLAIFDNWDFFSNDAGNKWPCKYFTGVSSIANAWRMARRITVDKKKRILTIVPFAVPRDDFSAHDVVIHNTGAVMLVTKRSEFSPEMPDWCLLLRELHQARIHAGPLPREGNSCILCEVVRHHTASQDDWLSEEDAQGLYRCTECTLVWHQGCAIRFRPGFDENWVCPVCRKYAPSYDWPCLPTTGFKQKL